MPKATPTQTPDVDPVTYEPPTVVVAGRTYRMKRLTLAHVFPAARILRAGVAALGPQAAQLSGIGPADVAKVLVAALGESEDEVLAIIASVLGVRRADLLDPDQFPVDSILDIVDAFAKHQDLMGFLARVQAMMERLPEMQTA